MRACQKFGTWTMHKPRICEERQVEVGASEVSYVSWDAVEEAWRRQGMPFF